jgi:hypothetical protein
MLRKLIATLLRIEALLNALHVAGLLSALPGHSWSAVTLILARGGLGALQYAGGRRLHNDDPGGRTLATIALVSAAALLTLDLGFNLAPMPIYPWWRWQAVAIYWTYALLAAAVLKVRSSKFEVRS